MQKICKKYALNMPKYVEICIIYAEKMHRYARNMYLICMEYAKICINMHQKHQYVEICMIYANNMQQICTNMQAICILYAYICMNMHAYA